MSITSPTGTAVRPTRWTTALRRGLLLLGLAFAPQSYAEGLTPREQPFDIPAQDLSSALLAFSDQTGIQVVTSGKDVADLKSAGVSGAHSAAEALQLLLADTGLAFTVVGESTVALGNPEAQAAAGDGSPKAAAVPATGGTGTAADGVGSAAEAAGEAVAATVESAKRGGIEEIIVTARKREESVQDIPISITAIGEADIKAFGIRNVGDMEGIVPGLNMGGGGNGVKKDSNPFIRGVGQRETKVTLDPAVGTYINGIYIGRAAGAMLDVAEVESIQVLRGPQGTLFGRNATGGAISVTTRKPSNEWAAQVGVNVGNYGRQDATLTVNAPFIKDELLGRLTVASFNNEGYFTNTEDNTKWNNDSRITGIGQLRWLPTDGVTVDVLGERTRIRERPRPQRCQFIRAPGFQTIQTQTIDNNRNGTSTGVPPTGPGFEELCRATEALPQDKFSSDLSRNSDILQEARYWVDTSTLGLTGTWDIGDLAGFSGVEAKSITAWRKTEQIADEDLDAVPFTYLLRIQPKADETSQISQEFQLSGHGFDKRLFASTGLYYFKEKTPQNELILSAGLVDVFNPTVSNNVGVPTWTAVFFEPAKERLETDNEAYAWFGQLDFDVTPEIQATAGLRYTHEERWSQYSKGTIVAPIGQPTNSIVNGVVNGGFIAQFASLSLLNHTVPGFQSLYGWEFSPLIGDELSTTDEAWTPMLSLKYKASPELLDALNLNHAMAYATYSVGFHAGGVTAGAIDEDGFGQPGFGTADPIVFKPEEVKNYEIGLKLAAFDRRLQANLALFYMDYTDMQVTAAAAKQGIPIPYIDNVGKSVIKGLEAEFIALPTRDWRIILNGSFTDADIKEWDAVSIPLGFFGEAVQCDPAIPSSCPFVIDRSNEPMPRVPRVQAFLMTDYTFSLEGGSTLTPSLAARYTSEIYHGFDRGSYCFTYGGVCDRGRTAIGGEPTPPNNTDIVPEPYADHVLTSEKTVFLDGRLSWVSADSKMEMALWGKNLTNIDDYLVGGIPLTDVNGATGLIYANPRTFGLSMAYKFGTP